MTLAIYSSLPVPPKVSIWLALFMLQQDPQ
ncbi:uncharacterized protein METZ01_LOCUS26413 [marine metagenome]|uniref:Uncharacterized protein n=1 Tax=marine metagenome TaxID=408172 RepID=A0A381Q5F1_9ZZZZ